MKFLRIILLSALFGLGCHGFSMAQNELNPYALVRVYEHTTEERSKITIAYEDGRTEIIALPLLGKSDNMPERMVVITKTLNKMVEKGYKIVATTGSGEFVSITTYIMEKIK